MMIQMMFILDIGENLLPRLKNILIQIIMSLAEKELKHRHLGGVLIQKLTQIPVTNAIKCL